MFEPSTMMRCAEYEKLEAYMRACMEDSAHDAAHIYRVLYTALEIAETEPGVNGRVLLRPACCMISGDASNLKIPPCATRRLAAKRRFGF